MKKRIWDTSFSKNFFTERIRLFLFVLGCSALLLGIFSLAMDQGKYRYKVGDVAETPLVAPQDVQDTLKTQELIDQAVAEVPPVEYVDPMVMIDVTKQLKTVFESIKKVMDKYPEDPDLGAEALLREVFPAGIVITRTEAEAITNSDSKTIDALYNDIEEDLNQVFNEGITRERLQEKKDIVTQSINALKNYKEPMRSFGAKVGSALLSVNRSENKEMTEQRIEEVKSEIKPVIVPKGQLIATEGSLLTEAQISLMRDANMLIRNTKERTMQLAGAAVVILITVLYLTMYLHSEDGTYKDSKIIYMIGVLLISMMGIALALKKLSLWTFPFATLPMLLTLLVELRTAIILNGILVVLLMVFYNLDPSAATVFWLGGFAASFSVRRAEQRGAMFISGIIGALVGVLLVFSIGFIRGEAMKAIAYQSGYVVIGGVASSVLLLGSMPVWELIFKILTPGKLLELSNPNHPLLKKLLMEAPGTYHHSILIGNLSESAAHAIGANALLARVGSFYHDIGKSAAPHYFMENQVAGYNPHDDMVPEDSVAVIRDHVTVGLRMASDHRLPQEIKDIIEQHHGSTLIKYFYHKATQLHPGLELDPNEYSYQGRTPRSPESAIIMLADSVEAAVRSLKDINRESIRKMIHKVFEDKQASGQLVNSQLSFSDLQTISERFEAVIASVYHERVPYPEVKVPKEGGE